MSLVFLEEAAPEERFGAGDDETLFLALRGEAQADEEQLREGDVFAVATHTDAEPGDLVVWWSGTPRTQALARVTDDLVMKPVGGFPAPPAHPAPAVRGVVVGRWRRLVSDAG